MVRGLDTFRERFAGFEDRYVLIGGAAVEVAMDRAGLEFRVTKDLDIVLHVQSLDVEFARAFWAFISEGGYEFKEKSTGKPTFYRFHTPDDPSFPFMIELFSATPQLIDPPSDSHLTPLPVADEVSSLSAILLDQDYYGFLKRGIRSVDGVSSKDVKKHRNDVIRLSQLITPTERIELPGQIYDDLADFTNKALHGGAEPVAFGVKGMSLEDVRSLIATVYVRAT